MTDDFPLPDLPSPFEDEATGFELPPEAADGFTFEPPPGLPEPPLPEPPLQQVMVPEAAPSRATTPATAATPAPLASGRALVFRVAGRRYAVAVEQIVQVEVPGQIVHLPHVPPAILGVTHLRGEIVSVVDLRSLVSTRRPVTGSAPVAGARLVVVRGKEGSCGYLVDRIEGVRRLTATGADAEATSPDHLSELPAALVPHILGIYNAGGETVVLTDLAGLLASPELTGARGLSP